MTVVSYQALESDDMLEHIDHINLVVQDLDTMQRFYVEALGLVACRHVTIGGPWIDAVVGLSGVRAQVIYLEAPNGSTRLELIHYLHPTAPAIRDDRAQPHLPGLRHLAFRVTDMQAMAERVRQAGGKLLSAIETVPESQVRYENGARKQLVYFLDPEGNLLELCHYG